MLLSLTKNKILGNLWLAENLNIDVEYIYILNDWFRNPSYKDTLDYVISVGCQYYFNYLPLQKLGFPVSK